MTRLPRRASWAAIVFFAGAGVALPWGFTGHRRIAAAAVERVDGPLGRFLRANARTIAEHSVDPDLWRAAGRPGEAPNHYFDIDALDAYPFAAIPLDEGELVRRFGEEARTQGRVPWRIAEVFDELVEAFRSGDGRAARARAAALAHYVADLHVPLHVTRNHDGQWTGQHGIHRRWESELVERYVEQIDWRGGPGPLAPVGDPLAFAFDALRRSYRHLEGLLASDLAARGDAVDALETPEDDRYGNEYYSRLYEREAGRLAERIAAAVDAVASLWREAWIRAGRPEPTADVRDRFVRGERRVVLLSWDGAGERLVETLLEEGKLPSLARLARRGVAFDFLESVRPPKTASAHASLVTGAPPSVHGITGNEVPYEPAAGRTALAWRSGYDARTLEAEPLWITAAKGGLDATVLHAAPSFPFEPFTTGKRFGADFGRRLFLVNGYAELVARDAVYGGDDLSWAEPSAWTGLPAHRRLGREFRIEVGSLRFHGVLVDTVEDPRTGFDRLVLATDKAGGERVVLAAAPAGAGPEAAGSLSVVLDGVPSSVFFRLFELSPDGTHLSLYRSRLYRERSNRPELAALWHELTGGFQGNDASDLYERGAFGPTLMDGGDGTAEARYLDVLSVVHGRFASALLAAIERSRAKLLVHYLPFPDDTQHLWYGYLDETLPSHRPALAARLRPFLEETVRMNDRLLGEVLDRIDESTVVALVSDHGVAGSDRIVYPNVALRRAGLLAVDERGEIDLARTDAFYRPRETAFVRVNRAGFLRGRVAPPAVPATVTRARRALEAIRDPTTGRAVFAAVVPVADEEGALRSGELYLSVEPGYRLSPRADAAVVVEPAAPRGGHLYDPGRVEMRGIFYLAGPGVRAGARLGPARIVDVAPTLAFLAGLEPPADATGRILEDAFADGGN